MKKTLAILLLCIYLFNLAGYSFVFQYLMHQSDSRLLQTIDAGAYNKSDVVTLKTPIHLPYYNGSTEFERVDGEVEINGTHYTYIQRRVSNDTLYVVCLLNKEKTVLCKSKDNFAKEAASLPAENKKEPNSNSKKNVFSSEYAEPQSSYSLLHLYYSSIKNRPALFQKLASGIIPDPFAPPDFS